MEQHRKSESGNVLWFILLALALLATLTATISRSTDTAEQSANIERYRVDASDIMRSSASIKQAVTNMRMRGVSESDLSFENNFTTADYTNAGAAGCADCLVFGSAGGGAAYRTVNENWLDSGQSAKTHYGDWYITGESCVVDVGTGGAGCNSDTTNNEELILVMPWIKQGLCRQINVMLGHITPVDPAPQDSGNAFAAGYPAFTGTYTDGAAISDTDGILDGEEVGCFEGAGTPPAGSYHFYQVLIKR